MKKYLTALPCEFTTLIFIVPAQSKQAAVRKAEEYYKAQFGEDVPAKIDVFLIPEKDEIVHLTNIRPIVQTVEAKRHYNYTPRLEYV